ncbi:MAG TPA: hypothetical protein PL066_03540 [bacterium]|nr:hypothetical protein [bacterium]
MKTNCHSGASTKCEEPGISSIKSLSKISILLVIVLFSVFPFVGEAAYLTQVSDHVSRHAPNVASDHEITFTTPSGVHASSRSIVIHFPTAFNKSTVDYTDIDFSHGPVTGYETSETLAAAPGVGVWGVAWSGNNLTFTSPTNAAVNEIAANDKVKIIIGLNAAGGNAQIINAASSGSYPVNIDGTFGDRWFFALAVTNDQVNVTANNGADVTAPTVQVLSPNGGEVWYNDTVYNITWNASDDVALDPNPIYLYYSINNGSSWNLIASNLANSGSYAWTLPNINSQYVKVRVSAYDSSANLGSDESDGFFTIRPRSSGTNPLWPEGESLGYVEEQLRLPLLDGSGWAYPGDLVKTPEYTTVYLFGYDGMRHYFPNEPTFKTWFYDFSKVKIVKLEDLIQLRLGKNIVARAGVKLVKAYTAPDVYAVSYNGVLHRVPDENVARQMYGVDWSKKIMDIPDVFWGDYVISGDDLTSAVYPLGTLIKYPNLAPVYLLSANGKRHLANEYAFYDNEYYWSSVLEVPESYVYADDSKINFREDNLNNPYYVSVR